jgi:ATP-dependent DNA ligase
MPAFDNGEALFQTVCHYKLEGVVAKRRSAKYRPGYRGWVKVKNPAYWRRESEIEAFRRSPARA